MQKAVVWLSGTSDLMRLDQSRKAEKEGGMSEDERHGIEADIQKETDKHIARVDEMLSQKEKDIMGV